MGELGRAVLDEDGPEGWPEFLPYVLQSASSSSTLTATAAASTATSCNANTTTAGAAGNGYRQQHNGFADAGAQKQLQQLQLSDVVKGGGVEAAGTPDAWARVVTGLRLMSSAAQHTAVAAAADPSAFNALVETLQRCLCWQGSGEGGGGSPDVRLEAVRALGSVVVACERPSDQASFSTCLPHLLQAIQGDYYNCLRVRESHARVSSALYLWGRTFVVERLMRQKRLQPVASTHADTQGVQKRLTYRTKPIGNGGTFFVMSTRSAVFFSYGVSKLDGG